MTRSAMQTGSDLPLSSSVRGAYQSLYDTLESALDNTMDAAVVEAINPSLAMVDQVLKKDDICRLARNTVNLTALKQQISDTNKGLKTLRDQVSAIAEHIEIAGDILAGIDKVLTMVPGL